MSSKEFRKTALTTLFAKFKEVNILIFGDLMLDEFIYGQVTRISPEAPVPILNYKSNSCALGGAANAAANILGLGGVPRLIGCLGEDRDGARFADCLENTGISATNLVVDPTRQTTLKTRVIAHNQHVVRIDREEVGLLGDKCADRVREKFLGLIDVVEGVIISDYLKGLVSPGLAGELIRAAVAKGLPIVVDTKTAQVSAFNGATIFTPNVTELGIMSGIRVLDDESLASAAKIVLARTDASAVLITRSEKGMTLFTDKGKRWHLPAHSIEVTDVTGAGDTVASVLGLALAAGIELKDAVEMANYAAAVVVRKVGTTIATPEEIINLIEGEGSAWVE